MLMDSAFDLQASIFQRIFEFEEIPSSWTFHGGDTTDAMPVFIDPHLREPRSRRRKKRFVEDIAIGIGAREQADTRISLFVQNHLLMNSVVVDDIKVIAKDEVDVIYIGRQMPLWTRERQTPLCIGCSTSPSAVDYSGTLGCFCKDTGTGEVGFLSNNHVLANVNQLPHGAEIVQQGAADAGGSMDVIGKLERFVSIQFSGLPNQVDAAFGLLTDNPRGYNPSHIYGNSGPPTVALSLQPQNVAVALPGMKVYKTGRTTCHTAGRVRAVNVNNYLVSMGQMGLARFDGQIMFEMSNSPASPFSSPGDSGSLIVNERGDPMALLFAGSQSGGAGNLGITAGNPISAVKDQLGITIV